MKRLETCLVAAALANIVMALFRGAPRIAKYNPATKVKTLGAYYHDFDPPSSRAMLRRNGGAVREARSQ